MTQNNQTAAFSSIEEMSESDLGRYMVTMMHRMVMHHVLRFFSDDRRFRLGGAVACVLVSATAFTVWNQSNVNEKVYTVSLLTIALLSWLVFRWQENLGKGKDDNLLILMAFILALSVGNHLMAFLAAPALLTFVAMVHWRTLLNARLYLAGVVVLVLGLSIHLFLPIRSELRPIINEAAPTCESVGGALTSVVTYGRAGCEELSAALKREQYDKPPLQPRLAPLGSQLLNYLQYFDWQWGRSLAGDDVLLPLARFPVTALFLLLGLYGATEHFRRDRPSFAYVAVLFGTLSVALVYYLNFKYGYSIPSPSGDRALHEVRERDYFFVVSFSVWGLWAGLGIAALWKGVAERTGAGMARAAPILGMALIPLLLNFPWASRRGDYAARDWAYNLLMSTEPYAVLFTNGDNDTFPLWYLQEVEGIRRDVTVIVTSYLNTDWYVKQLRDLTRPCPEGVDPLATPTLIRCQRPYDPTADVVYTSDPSAVEGARVVLDLPQPVTPPTRTLFDLDDETIESVAGSYVALDRDRNYQLGEVFATLRSGQVLYPWHQFALAAIASSIEDRPIYFASSGSASQTLGLEDAVIRQGLAFRLWNGDLGEGAPEGVVPMNDPSLRPVTGPWLDVPRTRRLLRDAFVHRSGIPDAWTRWPDRSTIGIPNYYAWAWYGLYQAALQGGDQEAGTEALERGEAWARLGS